MENKKFLQQEKRWVYRLLMLIAGFYGGYAMLVRGGAFSNAQTGNIILLMMSLGKGELGKAAYYVIPFAAYLSGTVLSELLVTRNRVVGRLRWGTMLIVLELLMVALMGFIPATAPHQICQIIINVICAMQFNTFREAEGVPITTTFCTNNVRLMGVYMAGLFRKDSDKKEQRSKLLFYTEMVAYFALGVLISTVACRVVSTYAIWLLLIPLSVLSVSLLHADLKDKISV